MQVFENHTISSFGKNFFKDLNPGKAPQYFLVIAIDIALVHICSGVVTGFWLQLFGGLTLLLGFILFSALQNKQELEIAHIVGQLKTARIVSVAVAVLALATAASDIQHYSPAFYAVLLVAGTQVFFALRFNAAYRWVGNNKIRVVNLPQLTLISSSLLIGFTFSTSDFATRSLVGEMEKKQFGDRYAAYPSDSAYRKPSKESNYPLLLKQENLNRELQANEQRMLELQARREALYGQFSDIPDSTRAFYDSLGLALEREDSLLSAERGVLERSNYYTEKDIEELRLTRKVIARSIALIEGLTLGIENTEDMKIPYYIWGRMRQEKLHFGLTSIVLFCAWVVTFLSIVIYSGRVNKLVRAENEGLPGQPAPELKPED